VPQLGERPLIDEPPAPQDPDAVAHGLDLAEDVRGEQDRLPALLGLLRARSERHLHQRVETARRLVQQQEIRAGGERRDQLYLLTIALGERSHLLARVQLEALDEPIAVGGVGAAMQPGQELERLPARQRRPQERLPGDVREPPVRGDRLRPGVDAEQLGPAGRRAVEPEQESDRGRLAGAVRPEVAVYLALLDDQIELVERDRLAVALGEALGVYRAHRV
jgi:hypothetical protein